jgi:hypothetical protein
VGNSAAPTPLPEDLRRCCQLGRFGNRMRAMTEFGGVSSEGRGSDAMEGVSD